VRYLVIEDSKVVNVVEAGADFAAEQGWILAPAGVEIGWILSGGNFVPAQVAPTVPDSITALQARLALLQAGLLADVEAAVEGLQQGDRLAWEYAATIRRYSGPTVALSQTLGLTEAEVDALFVTAASL